MLKNITLLAASAALASTGTALANNGNNDPFKSVDIDNDANAD